MSATLPPPMKPFFTPLLRRVYVVFALILAVHFAWPVVMSSPWNRQRLLHLLITTDKAPVRERAAADLAAYGGEEQLMAALRESSAAVQDAATGALLQLWFSRGGADAVELLARAQQFAGKNELRRALVVLNYLTRLHPFYAPGWDCRATVHWKLGHLRKAESACRKVVLLNPNHFAAWRSLGVCQLAQGHVAEASESLLRALFIAPEDRIARAYFRRCGELKGRIRNRPGVGLLEI